MRKFAKVWLFPFLILLITSFIVYKNYSPGTWLLGWDNLVPELNFKLNIGRSLSAVWQEYQGLGLLGGMAHAADLSRQIVLAGLSGVIPASFLRYLWTFLMLVVGPLGVYFFTKLLLKEGWRATGSSTEGAPSLLAGGKAVGLLRDRTPIAQIAAFSAAIFYIFNLATVQTFFTPFETFVSFYGFFPWLLFAAVRYLTVGKRTDLIIFAVISLLATSAFYVQTMFVVYAVFLLVLALEAIIRKRREGLARSLKLALVTLLINAFWLAPATYFAFTNAGVTQTSHINSIATPETQIMNQARSGFYDIATLKGYWFDYYDWDSVGQYKLLYQDWVNYDKNPLVGNVTLALFGVSVAGLLLIFFISKKVFGVSFIFLFGISYFMLSGGDIPLPLFSEAFRNVFTKWADAAALVYAVGLGFFVYIVAGIIKNNLKYIPVIIFSLLIIGGSTFTVLPVFQGKFVAGSMKVELPSYYIETINYFKNVDPTKRIASFPLTDFWGWKFNDWGHKGSGFIWYGIHQPILDRAFDVWSPYNERFYDGVNYAVSWGTVADLGRVFTKYQVSYIVFDESLYMPGNTDSTKLLLKQKNFLESSPLVSKEKTFGKITIYKIAIPEVNNFVSAPKFDYGEPIYKVGGVGNLVIKETFPAEQGYVNPKNCNLDEKGLVIKEKRDGGNYYKAENDGVSCDYFYYPTLDYSKAYVMRIKGKNLSGRSLRFYLYNVKGEKIYMDELLPWKDFDETYNILPTGSSEDKGYGYTLSVETRSFGKIKSENLVTAIEFYDLKVEKTEPALISNNLQILDVQKYGTWGYKIDIKILSDKDIKNESGEGLVGLGQGYEEGWVAFEIVDNRLKILDHTKVNSWANGWLVTYIDLSNYSPIYLFYWPQALEWGGFLVGGITLLVIIFRKDNPIA